VNPDAVVPYDEAATTIAQEHLATAFYWAILRFGERGVGLCERDGGELNIRAGDLRARSHFSPMARYFCYLTDNLCTAVL
jgi:hypothetical protein